MFVESAFEDTFLPFVTFLPAFFSNTGRMFRGSLPNKYFRGSVGKRGCAGAVEGWRLWEKAQKPIETSPLVDSRISLPNWFY